MPAPITTYRSLGYVGLVRETVPGTGQAPTKFYKFIDNPTLRAQQTIQYYRNGNMRDFNVALKETAFYKGGLKCLMYADEGAALLAWCFGKDVVSGVGDPYTHTITLLDTLPWLGGEVGRAEDSVATTNQMVDRIVDAKLAQLVIEGQAGKQIYATPEVEGLVAAYQNTTPTTQSFNDGATQGPFTFQQSVFTMTSLGSDSSTMAGQIQEFKITLNQNTQIVYGPAQLPGIGIVEKGRQIDLEFTVVFAGATIYRLGYFGGVGGSAFDAAVGTGNFEVKATAALGPERSVDITCTNFDIMSVDVLLAPNADLCVAKVTGRLRYASATLPLSAVVKNGVSAQYTA